MNCKQIIQEIASIYNYCRNQRCQKKICKIARDPSQLSLASQRSFLWMQIVPCLLLKDHKYFCPELRNMVQRTPGQKWKIRVLLSVSLLCTFVTEKQSLNLCDTSKWIRASGLVTYKSQGKKLQLTKREFSLLHGRCPQRSLGHCWNPSCNAMSCFLQVAVSTSNTGNLRAA